MLLAIGAQKARRLEIKDMPASGVISGIDFLRQVNQGEAVQIQERVAIIGGGNVAVDCARTCLRLGFKDVKIIYRRSQKEMPAMADEVEEAIREGVDFVFLATPINIIGDRNKVTGIECIRMRLGQPDASGRSTPEPVEGSEFRLDTDLLISAVGEELDADFIKNDSLSTRNGLIAADPLTLETNIAGIFAGGDAVTGPATVIEALAAGRKAAISIDRYLKGESLRTDREGEGTQISKLKIDTSCVQMKPRLRGPTLALENRKNNQSEVNLDYSSEDAMSEASRCLSCNCQICLNTLGCPAIMLTGDEITIDSSQCPGCGLCTQVCPAEALVQDSPR
jgi:NADPH-dependent glutamate synthase beta subunit-like oxidoreductase